MYLCETKRKTMTHQQLAKIWAQFNGQTGTAKQVEKICKQLTVEMLTRMLQQRNLIK
jgi:DNA-binding Xre family transcriptional regulator